MNQHKEESFTICLTENLKTPDLTLVIGFIKMSSANYVPKLVMPDLLCKQNTSDAELFFPMSFVNSTQSFYPYITSVPSR